MDVKVLDFEGPLALLLHLIKESKVDIFNIPMEDITSQYLSYLHTLEVIDLEKASIYLPLASELMEIKAKMLLPKNEIEKEEAEDPRDDLVKRLLEYEAYKEITKSLKEKEQERKKVYTKLPSVLTPYMEENNIIENDNTLDDLIDAFQKFLKRKEEEKPLKTKVTLKEITISSRRLEIQSILKTKKRAKFKELFHHYSRSYVVATFLAILEMARESYLKITQDGLFEEIIVEVKEE